MQIQSIYHSAYRAYGKVLQGYDVQALLAVLATQEKPVGATVYTPSCAALEALPIYAELRDRFYGGMPIQIGYCNGENTKLNCLEYHRDSEVNIFLNDTVLLVGRQQDIDEDGIYDTRRVEAFLAPAGCAVEFYATTLHYAPCDAKRGAGFMAAVVLPRGTNTEKPAFSGKNAEDAWLFAKNKWLLALPGTNEANKGAYVGLVGGNIDISDDIA